MLNARTRKSTVRLALIFEALLVPLAIAGIVFLGIDVHTLGLPVAQALLFGIVGGIATFALIYGLTRFEWFFRSTLEQHVKELHAFASSFSLTGIVGLAVVAGLGEELLFRALIQGWIAEQSNQILGVAVAAVLFGLMHFLSWTYFFMATAMGAIFGIAYVQSESLLLVVVWHAVYDLIALIVLARFPQRFLR